MARVASFAFSGALAACTAFGWPAPARAETSWTATEGVCLDWRGTWDLEPTGPGTWSGRIRYRHVGGSCVAGTGRLFSANVEVQVTGSTWRATRADCTYAGTIRDIQLTGTFRCVKGGGPFNVAITLPEPLAPPAPPKPAASPPSTPVPAPTQPSAPVAPPAAKGCPMEGSWRSQIGTDADAYRFVRSTWIVLADGEVREKGGSAKGRAQITGYTLTLRFDSGAIWTEYTIVLAPDCKTGSGSRLMVNGPLEGRRDVVKFTKVD